MRSTFGQQSLPEGPHCSTSGASHSFIKYHSEFLTGGKNTHTHWSILLNYSITQMETAITWKLCTSLRVTECYQLSDGGELELIGSRCWCVQVIYTIHVRVGGLCTLRWIVHHSAARYNQSRRLSLNPDLTTSGACVMYCHRPQHGAIFPFFFNLKTADLAFTLLYSYFLLHTILRMFYNQLFFNCYFCNCLHSSLSFVMILWCFNTFLSLRLLLHLVEECKGRVRFT